METTMTTTPATTPTSDVDAKKLAVIRAQKQKVIDLAREGAALRGEIHKAADRARYDLWNAKRAVGGGARWALLAYAYIRGRAYRTVEAACAELNPAFHADVLLYGRRMMARAIQDAGTLPMFGDFDLLVAWLAAPEPEAHRVAREAAAAAGQARMRVRQAEGRAAAQAARATAA